MKIFQSIRRYLITIPLSRLILHHLPTISATEREAVAAGDTWWETELFRGRPDWQKLHALPLPQLSAEEQAFINNQVETLCDMINDWEICHVQKNIPDFIWDYLKKERFVGLIIPKSYGGLGFSALAHSTIIMKIATRSASVAVTAMVPNSLGPAELLLHYGSEAQKNYYLPRLACGDEIPCFALTGPDAGSDASAMTDTGVVCYGDFNGEKILGIRLNWDKRYITLAPVATLLGLAFKLHDPDHLLGDQINLGITCCLIPTDHPGVEIGARHLPAGMAFSNGPTRGRDVFIPMDWIIGGQNNIGKGWRMLMECLSMGRAVSLPAISAATAKLMYRMTGAYALIRTQFKTSIARFEGIEEYLAKIAGSTYLIEATRRLTTTAIDQNIRPSLASAIAKYHTTELSRMLINAAMDIHGGRAIQWGPRNYCAPAYQAIPISITVEGANILTRNLIIFGQGAFRCHPFIQREMEALNDVDLKRGLENFDTAFAGHVKYIFLNKINTFLAGLSRGWLSIKLPKTKVEKPLRYYYRQLNRFSAAFSYLTDVTLLCLGGTLKRRERLSARLGDILSYLYLASAALKHYQDQNVADKIDHLPLLEWSLQYCLFNIQQAFLGVFNNFPNRFLGFLLRCVIFPYGYHYRLPNDQLDHKIATQMLQSSHLREQLTVDCYVGKNSDDVTGIIEDAFQKILKIESILKSQQAFTESETAYLKMAEQAKKEAIRVDEF